MPAGRTCRQILLSAALAAGTGFVHATVYGVHLVSTYQDKPVLWGTQKRNQPLQTGRFLPGRSIALKDRTAYVIIFQPGPDLDAPRREALLVFMKDGKAMDLAVFYAQNLNDPNRPVVQAKGSLPEYQEMRKHFKDENIILGFGGWHGEAVFLPELQGEETASKASAGKDEPKVTGKPATEGGSGGQEQVSRSAGEHKAEAPASGNGGESRSRPRPMDLDLD